MRHVFARIIVLGTLAAIVATGCGSASAPAAASVAPSPGVATPPSSAAASPSATEFAWSFADPLPSGWIEEDGVVSKSENTYIEVLVDRSVMASDCAMGPEPGVGKGSGEIVEALAERDGLVTSGYTQVNVGGLSGRQIDVAMAPEWTASCPWWEAGTAVVPLVGTFDEKNLWLFNAVTAGEQYRYLFLDIPGRGNVLVSITASEPERLDPQTITTAMSIVDGLDFDIPS